MKLKRGMLIKTNYEAYCLVTKVEGLNVFGVWLTSTYLDVSPLPAFDDANDTKQLTKVNRAETRYFLKSIFECFDKGFVRTKI
jgi:hypothetical protein